LKQRIFVLDKLRKQGLKMNKGTLTFIGLGLYDERDISLKGIEKIKKSDKIFAEFYTAKLMGTNIIKLQKNIGKKITILNRKQTEQADLIIDSAEKYNVAFLTAGDPLTATTHVDLRLKAVKKKIKTHVIHGGSIITAVPGLLGLQNYKFGRTTTIPYPEKNYFPISPYDVIKQNQDIGLHTLILLDINDEKNMYMNANEGFELLLKMEKMRRNKLINENSIVCVVARAGSEKPLILANTIKKIIKLNFGPPLHTIVIPGRLHFMEIEALMKLAQLPTYLGEKLQKV
jgi:diphthine synthase